MDLLNFFFNLHQIMYSFGKQREKIGGEGHFKGKTERLIESSFGHSWTQIFSKYVMSRYLG